MWHLTLTTIHAVAATAAAPLAVLALWPSLSPVMRTRLLRVHLACIAVLSGVLPISIAVGWDGFPGIARGIFIGLFAISVYMVRKALLALRTSRANDRTGLIDHLGFTLTALATGFAAIAVLRAGVGVVGIIAVAALLPVAGHFITQWAKGRVRTTTSREPVATAGA